MIRNQALHSTHPTAISDRHQAANIAALDHHHQNLDHPHTALNLPPMVWTTWWPWRRDHTRSHPELDRENLQRP